MKRYAAANVLILIATIIIIITAQSSDGKTSEECLDIGFSKPDLNCATCAVVKSQFKELEKDCASCCTAAFSSAVLEISRNHMFQYPGVADFVTNRLGKFKKSNVPVEVKQSTDGGVEARILLLDKDGNAQQEMGLTSLLDGESIEDFLRSHLPHVFD